MAAPEPSQRGVIRLLVRRDHPIGHVLDQTPLDPPRGPFTSAVGIDQDREHH
jgi:hypothetical protein